MLPGQPPVSNRSDFECVNECMWFEITAHSGLSLLVKYLYFPPEHKASILQNYKFSENVLYTKYHMTALLVLYTTFFFS
jgi:hypothetical protein